jgi:periplasmic divalent cation tolerance protein
VSDIHSPETTGVVVVLTTVPADHRADELARALVDERLAACVNLGAPMRSVYRWRGRIEHAEERQITIKTSRDRVGELERRLKALHPYDTPELLVVEVAGGSREYLAWVLDQSAR